MAEGPFEIPSIGAFDPALVQGSNTVQDTVGGRSLQRVLEALPTDPIAQDVLAESASPQTAGTTIDSTIFLRGLTDAIISETHDRVGLTRAHARQLGIAVAAATIEITARQFTLYAADAFADDIEDRVEYLVQTQATDYPEEERPAILDRASGLQDEDARRALAGAMRDDLIIWVDSLTLPEAARHASLRIKQLRGGDATSSGIDCNPWEFGMVTAGDEAGAVAQLGERSPFAAAMVGLVGNEPPSIDGMSSYDLYVEGVERTVAFVGLGVSALANQVTPPASD